MNKLIFVGVFLAAICYLAQVEAHSKFYSPEDVYELTVEQVKSFVQFIVDKLKILSQGIRSLRDDAIEFEKLFIGKDFI